ncbi:DUF3558 family protein [Actinoplanes sp. NEAU-A12]|uniref:DUF3558 family protein n=1 Tax=Actinoplanes sandaracinus TaxID=3045177 RepID=A0ABT6WID8_9ACTN|nr:DUF3558 family protein [Actinoplanes sandaracinus]MDI6099468.1 DUF3558 family protein [Actinoplanes sandaracinus]
MKHRLVALTAILAVALTGGCGAIGSAAAGGVPIAKTATAVATPAAGESAKESVKDGGDLPDPCTLLDSGDVADLTGREVTQVDEDGGGSGDTTRHCQWQQSGGQVAIFLTRTTAEDFDVTIAEAEWVDGVGQDAYAHSGHLYVLHGTVQIDVYSRGASDEQNLDDAKEIAQALIPLI